MEQQQGKDIKILKQHKQKIREANTGKKHSKETRNKVSQNNARWMLGKHHSEETRRKISETQKGKIVPFETKLKQSKRQNTSGYYRVTKRKDKRTKQGFVWVYKWRENGKYKSLSSHNILKLEEKVLDYGLDWVDYHLFEENQA